MIISVFFGLYNTLHSWLKMHYQEWRTQLTEHRVSEAEDFAADADQQLFITSKVLPLLKYICENQNVDLAKTQKYYFEKYDLDLSIYLFDKNGKLEQTAPKNAPNQWLMRNLFPYLIEKDLKKIETGCQQLDKKIEFTFGYGKNLISLREKPETIINSVSGGQECFFVWSARKAKSILIFGQRLPDSEKIINSLDFSRHKINGLLYAGKLSDRTDNEQNNTALSAKKFLSDTSSNNGLFNNQEWYFSSDKNGEIYYLSYKTTTSIYSRGILFLKFIFFIIIPLLFIILFRFSINIDLSLKQMVILIFLASSMIPIGNLSSESFENIETYTEIYQNELKSSMEEIINSSIQNFENYLLLCSEKLKKLTEPQNGIYDFKEIEKNVIKEFPDSKFALRNAASDIIYSNYPQYSSGQKTLYKAVGRICIKKYLPDRVDELPYTGNEVIEQMVSREDIGFSNICNKPNQLQFIYNSGTKMLLFVKPLPKEAGVPAILNIDLNIQNTMNHYIKTIDRRTLSTNLHQIQLIALNPMGFKWIIPPNSNKEQLLKQSKAALVTGKPIFRKIRQKGKTLYSMTISNSEIKEVCYTGLASIETLEREISRKKAVICICAIISIILFTVITIWIMSQLIRPLSDLETGIIALEKRNYETKIAVPKGKDEFVQLFKEFNYMMGENYDMQMAKNVQEGIITTAFPQAENYTISGITFPIDKLNGNCLTSFKMPDGKILFLIGNITGASIGSALMMAFIRSITFHWSQKIQNSPVELVEAIEQMFNKNRMEKMSIGLVCGILVPESSKIKFVTKGHIYPLFLRQNNTSEWLGQPSFPMGTTSRHKKVNLLETELKDGERMLCLTKGIIEIKSDKRITPGYDSIKKWAEQASNAKEQDWISSIKNKFDEWCISNNVKPTDDITLFSIICNKAKEKSET